MIPIALVWALPVGAVWPLYYGELVSVVRCGNVVLTIWAESRALKKLPFSLLCSAVLARPNRNRPNSAVSTELSGQLFGYNVNRLSSPCLVGLSIILCNIGSSGVSRCGLHVAAAFSRSRRPVLPLYPMPPLSSR